MQKETLLAPASSTCKDTVSKADVVKVALTNIPLCASNSYVMEPDRVINWIALIPTQRCVKQLQGLVDATGNIFSIITKLEPYRPIPHKPTSGRNRSTIPLMVLNLPPYKNNKRPPYPSLNHKASLLGQMNAIKQLMLDMQQAQSKLLLTMNQAWPLLQTNLIF